MARTYDDTCLCVCVCVLVCLCVCVLVCLGVSVCIRITAAALRLSEYRKSLSEMSMEEVVGAAADGLHEVVMRAVHFAEDRTRAAEMEAGIAAQHLRQRAIVDAQDSAASDAAAVVAAREKARSEQALQEVWDSGAPVVTLTLTLTLTLAVTVTHAADDP